MKNLSHVGLSLLFCTSLSLLAQDGLIIPEDGPGPGPMDGGSSGSYGFTGQDDFDSGSFEVGANQRWQPGPATFAEFASSNFYQSGGTLNFDPSNEEWGVIQWVSADTNDIDWSVPWGASVIINNTQTADDEAFVEAGIYAFIMNENGTDVSDLFGMAHSYSGENGYQLVAYSGVNFEETETVAWDLEGEAFLTLTWTPGEVDGAPGVGELVGSFFNPMTGESTEFVSFEPFDEASGSYFDGFGLGLDVYTDESLGDLNVVTFDSFFGGEFESSGMSPVPEPSTYAAMAGAAVLGLAVWRRRRTAPPAELQSDAAEDGRQAV